MIDDRRPLELLTIPDEQPPARSERRTWRERLAEEWIAWKVDHSLAVARMEEEAEKRENWKPTVHKGGKS